MWPWTSYILQWGVFGILSMSLLIFIDSVKIIKNWFPSGDRSDLVKLYFPGIFKLRTACTHMITDIHPIISIPQFPSDIDIRSSVSLNFCIWFAGSKAFYPIKLFFDFCHGFMLSTWSSWRFSIKSFFGTIICSRIWLPSLSNHPLLKIWSITNNSHKD